VSVSAKQEASKGFWPEPPFSFVFKKMSCSLEASGGLVSNDIVLMLDPSSLPSQIGANMHYARTI